MKTNALASLVLSAAVCALASCASQPVADAGGDNPAPDMARSCNADAAVGAVGKSATPELVEQARRDAGAGIARTLRPGQVVTMEYRGDRLNLDVDDRNVVTGVRCG
jgi:hypothetical protein